jgi:uncharacterized glyoxalase superfamily protein PhnB
MVPYLVVKDADKALDFYQRAFGFEKKSSVAGEDGRTVHAEMTYKDVWIMFAPEGAYGDTTSRAPVTLGIHSPMTLYVYCEDVDALCARAEKAGAKVFKPPEDMFWGDRTCALIDPDGHLWSFGTWLGQPPAK